MSRSRRFRRLGLLTAGVLAAGALALLVPRLVCRRPHAGGELVPGRAESAAIAPGEVHYFRLPLDRGDWVRLVAEQRGADVELALIGPCGRALAVVDSPSGSAGEEVLFAIAGRGGVHGVEVRGLAGEPAGGFALRLAERRPAGRRERAAVAALAALERGERAAAVPGGEAPARAEAELRQALAWWREAGEPAGEARTLRRLGLVLQRQGRLAEAAAAYEASLAIHHQRGELLLEVPLLQDLGVVRGNRGEVAGARAAFERARTLSADIGFAAGVLRSVLNLAWLAEIEGSPQQAVELAREAADGWRRLGRVDGEAEALTKLGSYYSVLGRGDEAMDQLERALELVEATPDPDDGLDTLLALGWEHFRRGDLAAALAWYDRAAVVAEARGDVLAEVALRDRRASVLWELRRLDEAEASYRQALAAIERAGSDRNAAHTLTSLGRLRLERGDPEEARSLLALARRRWAELGDRDGEALALALLASTAHCLGEGEEALALLDEAMAAHEEVRASLSSLASRRSFLASRWEVWDTAVAVAMDLARQEPGAGHAERAFEMAERARARGLLDSLAEARAGVRRHAGAGVLADERALRRRIDAAESERLDRVAAGDGAAVARIAGELRALWLEVERLRTEIRQGAAPRAQPLDLAAIQREVLDDDTLLLAYWLAPERSFVWAVAREGPVVGRVLAPAEEIEALARDTFERLEQSGEEGEADAASAAAAALADAVLGPVAAEVERFPRLAIVADGALAYVPFAALPAPAPAGTVPGERQPLLAGHTLVHLPSASALGLQRRALAGRPPAPRPLVVVADPVYETDDERLTGGAGGEAVPGRTAAAAPDLVRAARSVGLDGFHRLRHTRTEADAVLRQVPGGRRIDDFEATREQLLGGALAGFGIVHLAAHGVASRQYPELSGLVMSLVDEGGRPIDGFVRAHELYDLQLDADLVVLSACQTGLGAEVRGEGLVGLAQGFFYAGARRVLVSHWNVDDLATAELMARFYAAMEGDGLPPAAAYRQAALELRREPRWQAPYFWAAFSLQGDWR